MPCATRRIHHGCSISVTKRASVMRDSNFPGKISYVNGLSTDARFVQSEHPWCARNPKSPIQLQKVPPTFRADERRAFSGHPVPVAHSGAQRVWGTTVYF